MTSTSSIRHQQSGEAVGRTDLGRRIAARRIALGLSREELGRMCGADGNYVAYLEEHAASPAIGTLVRVAHALGVTVDDLTGANVGRTQGRSTARLDAALVPLAEDECRTLLGTHGVGRIAVFTPEGPAVLPVNYLVAGADIAFRTAGGWSVLAVGELEAVTDSREIQHLTATARSQPWAGGPRTHWMKLTPVRLTGRRVVHES
ncbi:helix-turn-helix domain-containing protein [Streptomyces sp. NPDC127112]|uniref:helix-turn-helix domain-containing protein n=1 Tax=Streptomyces sp. NPDC127112 TaxID=3345364 RepID=UPI003631E0B7